MTENDPSAPGEPLSERLRREGERSLNEHRVWQDIVTGEKIEEAKRVAQAVVLDALQRAPLRQWFPETRWIQVAVVARNGNVRGTPTYGEWPPNESTGHYLPTPALWPRPVGVVVEPADDTNPFRLLLVSRDVLADRVIDVQVVLVEPHEYVDPVRGHRWTDWYPFVNINGPARLARALASPQSWPQPPLQPPAYGWGHDPG
jgi:hypothetical protein